MSPLTEKRREPRRACDASVEWAFFNRLEFHPARLRNVSPAGGYFECGQRLAQGVTLQLRLRECLSPAPENGCLSVRTNVLCEVKWCRELGAGGAFGVGVRYHFPV
ncbi:MAG: PilZ domain-containing protein [Desulfobacterales bacterium]